MSCMCLTKPGSVPEIHQQLSLREVLHLIPGDVVDRHSLVAVVLQAAIDVKQEIHVIIPAARLGLRPSAPMTKMLMLSQAVQARLLTPLCWIQG